MDLNEPKAVSKIAVFAKPALEKGFSYPKQLNKSIYELRLYEKLVDAGKAPVKSFLQLGGVFGHFVHIINLLFDKPPFMEVILNNLFLDLLGQCRNDVILHGFLTRVPICGVLAVVKQDFLFSSSGDHGPHPI